MSTVWRGRLCGDRGFERTVAIKQMHPHLAEQPMYVAMFVEEARIGASLHHPNIAQTYDFLESDGLFFLVMEWVEGIDLGSYIHHFNNIGRTPQWDLVTAIGVGIARGLAAAHERIGEDGSPHPVIHRDISPHNILLTEAGRVKLIDFGLALADDRTAEDTEPGIVKGKMSYLSPEIVAGERPTPMSDQFAAGSVLWESLVGRKLFDGGTDMEIYAKVRDAQVQPLRPLRADAPKELVVAIHRALAARHRDRFNETRDMAQALSVALSRSRARNDLHVMLGRTVIEARASLRLGRRTGEKGAETPIVDVPQQAEIHQRPDVELPPQRRWGLRHLLPFFGRK
jgi:serine/threonine-protein kinase